MLEITSIIFESGNKEIGLFLKICHERNMHIHYDVAEFNLPLK